MKRLILAASFAVLPLSAFAQQQLTPSQLALQIDNAVNSLAQTVEQLQKELQVTQARVNEIETKCGDACKAPEPKK